ncbi:phenylalanine--tRNA ligase subunit beta [Shewanella xiamenensis]|uniref:Phenylalanine--tRNA ligase beta subunit n=1 Tax=Shewanella xiamenensis TaxID=332186 RepID=A0ABT6UAH4_9GAMM|nr:MULTISPECIES: phenylalanine--tRNA ligase subunit beta [Shewanella]MCH7421342.1 phenylalanine--tRNA ligase subunit beta [Shewanella sp. MM_2022_3]MCT8868905.1 phenylalanine--tRNA ligase subunit beta [Shewanella xiamenensis]MDI5830740.1 phenylalanine--tRNA ligase subunit beta [Shewanella xiamenensis]MDL3985148.1 phenylalanine--tRNA ligase subunit beta [Shewanella xiamenensis]NSM24293.1 phenylalanine--tRNA ligase subunit beta [Shewanella sp. ZOR0012]
MKFSESWLREWVNPAVSREALSHQITMAGLEVDGVDAVAAEFSGVVIGEVVECGQHPDADKLRVTKVSVGSGELIDIVCGAPNCRQGLKVAVAMVGAVLPGDFKIKKAKLRGMPSEGMLCSYSELGIDIDSDGIIELPLDAPLGKDLREYLQLDDAVIEVDLTANRADCLGMVGLAREVGVLNRQAVTEPQWQAVTPSTDAKVAINVKETAACPRYLGRVVKNVNVKAATPLWMQEKLRRSGIRSIDPIVDITNFVLVEFGQPMHAFDLAKLTGDIQVRLGNGEEKITLLDGSEVTIPNDTLVIADDARPLALAGVFGGEYSGVSDTTQDILLECAFFAPLAIMGKSRRLGLHTDSSHRFERGVDPEMQHKVMDRATRLVLDICGGEAGPVVEAKSDADLPKPAQILLRRSKLDKILGHHVPDSDVVEILERLGFGVVAGEGSWQVTTATYRFDMAIEEDLIEEVARIYGYNNIPNVAPVASLRMSDHKETDLSLKRVRSLLVARGFQEAVTYSFVDPKLQNLVHPGEQAMVLPNPISSEMSAMRLSMFTGLLTAVGYNQSRQQGRVRLFETGLRFVPDIHAESGVRQQAMLGCVITGLQNDEHWSMESKTVDFFDLKGDLEAIIGLTVSASEFSFRVATHSALHPGQCAEILRNDRVIGHIGAIHPSLEKPFGLNGKTIVFELELDALLHTSLPLAQAVSKFPANRRDIAVVVDESVSAGDVMKLIRKVGENQLVGINLFDVYLGKGVEPGKKSLAIALTLQDTTRTLEEKEIAETVDSVVSALKTEFNASLRD